jgi:signal transduction histidine kinase
MMVKKLNALIVVALVFSLTCLASVAMAKTPDKASAKYAAQEKQIKAMVAAAAKLIKAKGEAAFPAMNVKNGAWHKGDTAIFVSDEKGVELVNASAPEMLGKSLWDYKDPDGKLVVQEEWKLVKAKGKGWIDCKWAKPGTDQPVPCRSYVQGVKIKGKVYLVGAAYYPE